MNGTEGKKICIEDIMKEIRKEISEKGLDSSMLSFEDIKCDPSLNDRAVISEDEYQRSLSYINLNYSVEPYKPLEGNRLIVFIRKVMRKLIKFYIEPAVHDQNNINMNIVKLLNFFADDIRRRKIQPGLSELEKRLDEYELDMKKNRIYTESLEKRIALLEKENETLRKKQD
ncbi:MAG: hypothetical protein E7505_08120 [Ruminococcus sp.]|nr:hypothetical protein [Ruminococcus sp.]